MSHSYIVGYRQTVRQRTLTPSFQGSNPCSPVKTPKERFFGVLYVWRSVERKLVVIDFKGKRIAYKRVKNSLCVGINQVYNKTNRFFSGIVH